MTIMKPSQFMRRWRPSSWHMPVHFPTAAAIIGAWICLGILTGLFVLYAGKEPTPVPGNVAVNVQSVVTDPVGTATFTPGPGNQFVTISLRVHNMTGRRINLAPVTQTYVTDSSGVRYAMSPHSTADPLPAGPLLHDSAVAGTLSYNLPQRASGLQLHVDIKQAGLTPMTIALDPFIKTLD